MNESEKRLLKAVFENKPQDENEGLPDNYPDTDTDKIGYAAYVVTKSLEYISPALQRLYRCEALCKLNPPNIITNNESRMALEHLIRVKRDIDDAYNEVLTVYKRTKDYSQPIKEKNGVQADE